MLQKFYDNVGEYVDSDKLIKQAYLSKHYFEREKSSFVINLLYINKRRIS